MIGAKPGGTVLVSGASDPAVAAEVALVTGLNGRTLVVVPPGATPAAVLKAAAAAGALVEVEAADPAALPAADGSFDVAVVTAAGAAPNFDRVIHEAARVVRPGGRVVVIRGRKVSGLRRLLPGGASESGAADDLIISRLSDAGLRGTRLLGHADGVSYFEGTK
jgi:SAM-dependent methyltransferase